MPTWRYLSDKCGHTVLLFGHKPLSAEHSRIPNSQTNSELTPEAEATIISYLLVLLQLYVTLGYDDSFLSFAARSGIFVPHAKEDLSAALQRIADVCAQLIASRNDYQWTILIDDTSLLSKSGWLPAAWPFLERVCNMTKTLGNTTLRVLLYTGAATILHTLVPQFRLILIPSFSIPSRTQYLGM